MHIPEEHILHLFNIIVPKATQNQYPNLKINFNYLNQLSLPTIGFYREKQVMGRIFKEMGVEDHLIHMQIKELFEVGSHDFEAIHKCFLLASKKQNSFNLCDDIYVCIEDHNLLKYMTVCPCHFL